MPTMTQAGYTPPKPEAPKKTAPPPKKKKKKKRGASRGAAIVSLIIFLLAAGVGAGVLMVYAYMQPYADTFVPGTFLGGQPLSGMTYEEAEKLIAQTAGQQAQDWSFTMTWDGQSYVLDDEIMGLCVDAEATLEPMWMAAREGGVFSRFMQLLALREAPVIGQCVLTYSMDPADALLAHAAQDVACEPVDAVCSFAPGTSAPFSFTDEVVGLTLDTPPLRAQIERSMLDLTPMSVALEPVRTEPAVYRAQLENATTLRARMQMRVPADEATMVNLTVACAGLSGQIIAPGETISFNAAVGSRTEAAGYVQAAEPAYGADAYGVGGGVCIMSTAFYRAAMLSGMELVSRSAAVRPVDYCAMGQEAVVSDQGLDLVLRNPTDSPMYIASRLYEEDGEAVILIDVIGEPLTVRYELETQALETQTITEPVYVRDHEGRYATYTDERVSAGEGEPGYSALVERVGYDAAGAEVSREAISEDEYAPVPPAIYVGVRER